jgi:hypothetical protein
MNVHRDKRTAGLAVDYWVIKDAWDLILAALSISSQWLKLWSARGVLAFRQTAMNLRWWPWLSANTSTSSTRAASGRKCRRGRDRYNNQSESLAQGPDLEDNRELTSAKQTYAAQTGQF